MKLSGYSYVPLRNQKKLDIKTKENTLHSSINFTSLNCTGKQAINPIVHYIAPMSKGIKDNSEYSKACKEAWKILLEENNPAKISKIKKILAGVVQGKSKSQESLGNIYYHEKNDFKAAKYWYEQSGKQGNDSAQYFHATLYYDGLSVEKDHYITRLLLEQPAKNGNEHAQALLGYMHLEGEGGEVNYKLGKKLVEQSAQQGHNEAKFLLGVIHYNGIDGYKDLAQAKKLFTEAANEDHGFAQYYLGNMYLNGDGIPKDTNYGIYWLKQSYKNGISNAQIILEKLGIEI